MNRKQLIQKYTDFFKSKNHKEISNTSLVPENDPTVLFTTAGMHPLVPFLLGQKHPLGKRLVGVQRCIRTGDIDEVGDETHHTFFEMLGNWSLGDYWKKESIEYSFEFLTSKKWLGLNKNKIAVSVFSGDKDASKDAESKKIWLSLEIPKERIAFLGKKDNWWGPAGETGPCGPDTEIFYWRDKELEVPEKFDVKDKRWVEIWNNVFMEYNKDKRIILVDGMHCLYDENFNLNQELLEAVNSFNSHYILVGNKFREKGYNLVKNYSSGQDTNWKAFSLEEKEIKKDNPEYFKEIIKKFNLVPEEIIYFDHDKTNIETAKKLGILSQHYIDIKQVKKFIEENFWAFIPLKQKNVDTGMGVERTIAVLNGLRDNYLTDCFKLIIEKIEKISNKDYEKNKKEMRIIADHIKAAVFIIADGIAPGNSEQEYVLRRLIRRAVRYGKKLAIKNFTSQIAEPVFEIYDDYPELKDKNKVLKELEKEEERFNKTLEKGLNVFNKITKDKNILAGKDAFLMYQSYGFPIEMVEEECRQRKIKFSKKEFEQECQKHQELSRTASAGKFKSGLADNSEATTKLHTATHLLNEALRKILGTEVKQRGSNITSERIRFDFTFDRKLTQEEIQKIENLVNEKILENLKVTREEMSLKKAFGSGAQGEFGAKYPEKVSVYTIGDFSKEICTGPHVKNTCELGKFKIIKEESSSTGVRRIKATLEE